MENHALDTDFFFTRLKQEVHKFYTQYYFGTDRKWKKHYHVKLMREYYEPDMFKYVSNKERRVRKEEFLSMIQLLVDSRLD